MMTLKMTKMSLWTGGSGDANFHEESTKAQVHDFPHGTNYLLPYILHILHIIHILHILHILHFRLTSVVTVLRSSASASSKRKKTTTIPTSKRRRE